MWEASHMNTWYPSGNKLLRVLDAAHAAADLSAADSAGKLRAIIVPHAGYAYCVNTSMHAFKCISPDDYERVVVLGPSHFVHVNFCMTADATAVETPFGNIPLDTDAIKRVVSAHPDMFKAVEPKVMEIDHSLEMQFPLLKYIFKEKKFTLVPFMVPSIKFSKCAELAAALKEFADDPKTLFVISSDFTHWGKTYGYTYLPEGDGQIYERIRKIDMDAVELIKACDFQKFTEFFKKTKSTICGKYPIGVMMQLFPSYKAQMLAYSQSSKVVDKNDYSVSYVAAAIKTP